MGEGPHREVLGAVGGGGTAAPFLVLFLHLWARTPQFQLVQDPQPWHWTQGQVRGEGQLLGAAILRAFSQA